MSRLAAVVTAALVVGACAMDPEPLSDGDVLGIIDADRAALDAVRTPASGPLTLYEVMARALLFNLEHRILLMEEAVAQGQMELATMDMLPTVVASAGYVMRDNYNASRSMSLRTRQESLESSFSEDRQRETADLRASWNILDFGVSYFQAKQESNRFLIAQSNRQRIVLNLLQQSRAQFWRAVASQTLGDDVRRTLGEAKEAQARVETALERGLETPLELLQFKRSLLEIISQLETLDESLETARVELAQLINQPPGTGVELVAGAVLPSLPSYTEPVGNMERLALFNSPAIREETYNIRIEQQETYKTLARLMPGLEFTYTGNYDSNSFLKNQSWHEASIRVTWNLLRATTFFDQMDQAEQREELAMTRRAALNASVVAQTHVAWKRYQDVQRQLGRAEEMSTVENQILDLTTTAQQADQGSDLERIRSEVSALRASLQRYQSYAETQESLGALFVTLGLNPVPDDYREMDVKTLSWVLEENFRPWENGTLPTLGDDGALRLPTTDEPEESAEWMP